MDVTEQARKIFDETVKGTARLLSAELSPMSEEERARWLTPLQEGTSKLVMSVETVPILPKGARVIVAKIDPGVEIDEPLRDAAAFAYDWAYVRRTQNGVAAE